MIYNNEIERFIEEDLGYNDISCTMVPDICTDATIFVKQDCVIAGLEPAEAILQYFDLDFICDHKSGDHLIKGDVVFSIKGNATSVLRAERLMLNFLGHLSGIATLTEKYVSAVRRYSSAKVAATRKTTPGMRKFEKMAVIAGGGDPHRYNLSDTVMIKDNHRNLMGLEQAIRKAREMSGFTQKIDVEVESVEDALLAARNCADIIMLDNTGPGEVIQTIQKLEREGLRDRVIIEVSGNITLENIAEYAKTGADIISVGSLIHKSQWIDISLEFNYRKNKDDHCVVK